MNYKGKSIDEFTDLELTATLADFKSIEDRRNEASKHVKFNADRELDNKKIPKMQFPPINPEYLKIKMAIETEIKKRNLDANWK